MRDFDFGPEYDIEAVKRGEITEEERIARAYRRIHREQLKRSFLKPRSY